MHFGVRNDSEIYLKNMQKFFDDVFFPTLKKNNIKHVICTGDVYHNRRKIDVLTAHISRKIFFEKLAENDITMDVVAGNHDIYDRETSRYTAFEEFLKDFPNLKLYKEPVMISDKIAYIPWINADNRARTEEFIAKNASKNVVAFGHLELVGYAMYKGSIAVHGDDPLKFNGFKHVYTGHYHSPSTAGNISYIGSN